MDTAHLQQKAARIVQDSGVADRVLDPPVTRDIDPTRVPGGDKDTLIRELQQQLDDEVNKNRKLEAQFKFRVGSFVRRETQAKKTIETLERQLQDKTDEEHHQRMNVIRNMHDSVIQGLEGIQSNTAKALQEQEKDLMRSFRARLQDLTRELESQKAAKGNYSAELQARHQKLMQELQSANELAQIFDKKNQHFLTENQKLQDIIKTREDMYGIPVVFRASQNKSSTLLQDDRHALLKELVHTKKEIVTIKNELQVRKDREEADHTALKLAELEAAKRGMGEKADADKGKLTNMRNKQYERELAYRDTISRLQKLLEGEKLQVRTLKESNNELLQSRTELEMLLRQCLDDVKLEIARKQHEATKHAHGKYAGVSPKAVSDVSLYEVSQADRERVLELLLSQQRVVQLLYDKSFPDRPATPRGDQETGINMTGAGGGEQGGVSDPNNLDANSGGALSQSQVNANSEAAVPENYNWLKDATTKK